MTLPRLIPCLLLKGQGLYKSIKFQDWKYIGDPRNAIRIFNQKEVDELVLLDVEVSKIKSELKWSIIEECAGECFMPLAYGGGVSSPAVARKIIGLGIEKIILNSTALDNPNLIREISQEIGTCSTVICLDTKKDWRGKEWVYDHRTKKTTDLEPVSWAEKAVELGAGEVVIQSVDRDGTYSGLNLELLNKIVKSVPVPVTILGGCGSLEHCKLAWRNGASGVSAGSWFVLQQPHRAVLITYPEYKEIAETYQSAVQS